MKQKKWKLFKRKKCKKKKKKKNPQKKIESDDNTKYDTFYSKSKAEIIISESDIYDIFRSIYTRIIPNIHKSLGKSSDWIINSVIEHNISISKYNH